MLLIAVSDLMFQSRIQAAADAAGVASRIADSADALKTALASGTSAAVVDIHDREFDAIDAIRNATTEGATVLAFGRHTEPALLRAARDAGAAIVVPRSQLVEDLAELLERITRVGRSDV